jgi:hypothetical protein
VMEGAPDPVRAAVHTLLAALTAANEDPAASRMARQPRATGDSGFLLFRTTSWPQPVRVLRHISQCCVSCPECTEVRCAICLPVTLTPRTASVPDYAVASLNPQAYDYIYQTGMRRDGGPRPAERRAHPHHRPERVVPAALRPTSTPSFRLGVRLQLGQNCEGRLHYPGQGGPPTTREIPRPRSQVAVFRPEPNQRACPDPRHG